MDWDSDWESEFLKEDNYAVDSVEYTGPKIDYGKKPELMRKARRNMEKLTSSAGRIRIKKKEKHEMSFCLHDAVYYDYPPYLHCFLQEGWEVDVEDSRGMTALHVACLRGGYDCAKMLVDHGSNVNIRDGCYEMTPLHMACISVNSDMRNSAPDSLVEYLLEQGADVGKEDGRGRIPLHTACQMGSRYLARLILKKMKELDEWNKKALSSWGDDLGCTPLHLACTSGNADFVEYLLNLPKTDMSTVDNRGNTLLHVACTSAGSLKGSLKVIRLLISKGADVNAPNSDGETPLFKAFAANQLKIAKFLIKNEGADVNVLSENGLTCMHAACKAGSQKAVDFLLEKRLDSNQESNGGLTPVGVAAHKNHVDLVWMLLSNYPSWIAPAEPPKKKQKV